MIGPGADEDTRTFEELPFTVELGDVNINISNEDDYRTSSLNWFNGDSTF